MRGSPALTAMALMLAACGSGDARPKKDAAAAARPAGASAHAGPAGVVPAGLPRAAAFSADRAWRHLEAQVALGPRAHGLPGHEKLRALMAEHLRACGAKVQVHEFSHQGAGDPAPEPFWNVIGWFRPDAPRWVLLGTHYDTRLWADEDPDPGVRDRPIPGANDGGSGTAVLLEIASVLKDIPPDHGVALVFFDGEDYGRKGRYADYFLGSLALARDWQSVFGSARPEASVVLDMVADADLGFKRETKSMQAAPWLTELIWSTGQELRVPAFAVPGHQPIYDDQDALLGLGVPSALVIDYDYPWWHHAADSLDKCAPASLAATGRTVLAALVDRFPAAPAQEMPASPAPDASKVQGRP